MVEHQKPECLVKYWIALFNFKVKVIVKVQILSNICPDIFWTFEPFVTKFGMVMYHHTPQYPA